MADAAGGTLTGNGLRDGVISMVARHEDALFAADGTQAPNALAPFSDPLSGLIAAAGADLGSGQLDADEEPDELVVAAEAEHMQFDPETVQEMVDRALDDQAAHTAKSEADSGSTPPTGPGQVASADQPLGMLSGQRRWSARPPQLRRPRMGGARVPKAITGAAPAPRGKPTRGSTGVAVAVVLLVVFAIVVVQLLSSLFSSVSGVFN